MAQPNRLMGLDTVELVMAFEEDFGVVIPDDEASQMLTPRRVIDFIGSARNDLSREDVASRIQAIVLHQTGIAPADYGEDKEFVRDIGLD